MNLPIYLWKDALDQVHAESLLGCTIEIWYWPEHVILTGDDEQERARETFRCVIEDINIQATQPFKTKCWLKFNKQSSSWEHVSPLEHLLEVSEERCFSGIHVRESFIDWVSPTLNTHLLFYRHDECVPHEPTKPLSSAEIQALLID